MKNRYLPACAAALAAVLTLAPSGWAQQSTAPKDTDTKSDDVIQLSPFEVSSTNDQGYAAATTLAGNRLNTDIRDIGNAVTVITSQFMKDIGATDNQTLLQYTTNTEVGNVLGNFSGNGDGSVLDESPHFINPNTNTRVRGLTSADNTRDYFLTDIPWDSYNVDGVDLQRGPNSILFGQGSPAGIINSRLKQASFKDANEVQFKFGSNETNRVSLDINRVLIKDELAFRIAAVRDDEKYREDPAYSLAKRLYTAGRWEPGFLKKGSARTIVKADVEYGDIQSNNPRTLPPIDLITPWFYTGTYQGLDIAGNPVTYNNLNRETLIPRQNEDDNTGLANHGQNRPAHNGVPIAGLPNQYYQPWVGNFGSQFGNPTIMYSNDSSTAMSPYIIWEPKSNYGIGPDGASDLGVGGIPFQRPAGIAPYAQFAVNAHLPNSALGLYKDRSLTDPTVFDFFNNLIDGPNKKEWQNFRTVNLTLDQTFFNEHAGFEASYNNEWAKSGQLSLLSGDKQAIGIDFNSVYSDGSPAGINGQSGADGTPNPNLGRPYVSDTSQYGNSSHVSNKEVKRITVFGDYDFGKGENPNWILKFIGRQVITGLADSSTYKTDDRNWQRYGTDDSWEKFVNNPGDVTKIKFTDNSLTPNSVIYLGPSLSNSSTASGAFIPRVGTVDTSMSGNVRVFDSTWNKPTNPSDPGYVDPAAYWHNDYYPVLNPIDGTPFTAGDSTQSENPANYVGWRNLPINIIDSEASQANRDLLTHDARLTKTMLSSTAFTWQAHFWDNAIVATYGVRKDIQKSWADSLNVNSASSDAYGHLNLSPSNYNLSGDGLRQQVTSHAYSIMGHLSQFPGLDKVMKNLPIDISVFYNHSTDFQPAAARVDIYGEQLGPPEGVTYDRGILLETKDRKYSLKINRYVTTSTNFSTPTLSYSWFIGSSQAWAANWVNRFEFNWTADNNSGAVAVNDPTNSEYNYAQSPGQTLAQAQTEEANVIAAWRAWQKSVDPRFYAAWGINLNNPAQTVTANAPNGLAITEDSTSKGYEIEFMANPTKNWRLAINASKTDAVRNNVGGAALSQFAAAYANALQNSPVGDLRIWWGGAGNETTLQEWYSGNQPFGSQFAQVKLEEGTAAPELRQWHYNAITNYEFDHGFLKGVNAGMGVRYESSQIIGYAPLPGATLANFQLDIAHPYRSPSETDFDFWVGYKRRVWKNVDWNIQLNIRNAFVGDELIPITVQPDGSPAAFRIRPPQTWELTNTFSF
jgi:hypothetical protein